MSMHAALAASATVVAFAFALSTLERWLADRKPHELAWTVSLFLFAAGSAALWSGAAIGWDEWTFKAFYLFGAILNVPFLALGTVYLLCSRRVGDISAVVVSLLAAFVSGIVVAGTLVRPIVGDALPQGSTVFAVGPRVAAAVGSGVASLVILVGALWSAARLGRVWWRARTPRSDDATVASGSTRAVVTQVDAPRIGPGRLAVANILIAVGTLVLGAGGASNSLFDAMTAFSVSLVVGITVIFIGFLVTAPPTVAPVDETEWHPPTRVASATTDDRPEADLGRHPAAPRRVPSGSPSLN